jgi:hypothetical protein
MNTQIRMIRIITNSGTGTLVDIESLKMRLFFTFALSRGQLIDAHNAVFNQEAFQMITSKTFFSLASALTLTLALTTNVVWAHKVECDGKVGVEKARCERHVGMAKKCGELKGEDHFKCDREYLMANPLDCTQLSTQLSTELSGAAIESCKAEVAAFKTCETNQGREFMRCVKKMTGESPMGH